MGLIRWGNTRKPAIGGRGRGGVKGFCSSWGLRLSRLLLGVEAGKAVASEKLAARGTMAGTKEAESHRYGV